MHKERLKKLQDSLKALKCDALLIDDPTNLFYLTGLDLSAGKIIAYKEGAALFVDGRYIEACRQNSPFPVRSVDTPPLAQQLALPPFDAIKTLGFDTEHTSYKAHQELLRQFPTLTLVPVDSPLEPLRAIKDAHEADLLKQAGELGSKGFDFVCSILKEGITEAEVAAELEIFWKRKGSRCLAFDPIIAFGKNSSMPHYRAGSAKLKAGDVVLIDIGVNINHYHSDMTRIAYFGTPDPRIVEIHRVVEQAQKAAIDISRPGTTLGELDAAARGVITAAGFGDFFTHNLGHGVGLEIHEYPSIRRLKPGEPNPFSAVKLAAGMVITIEPGIYLPGIGGIRIEDTLLITDEGHDNLTNRPTAAWVAR